MEKLIFVTAKTRIFLLLTILLMLLSCSGMDQTSGEISGDEAKYKETLKAVAEAKKGATAANNKWRDTKKFMKKAKEAAEAGDFKKALKLANKAKFQYEMAAAQVKTNEEQLKNVPFYNADATPEEDLKNIQKLFREKFPKLTDADFANGFYALDKAMFENWVGIEEFPPYEPAIEEGEGIWQTSFKNGKSYNDCFKGPDILTDYPRWDKEAGEVETLPMAINKCRKANGEKPLKYGKHDMLSLQAYIAFKSRGKPTNVVVPSDDPRALEAYKAGKKFYFSRRGQINMACYHCHFGNSGNKARGNMLGPTLGQTTHWPTYRSKWGGMGSLHRRYKGCNKQVRAKPFDLQSVEYRNLEYFHTFISNGIPSNGPGSRF